MKISYNWLQTYFNDKLPAPAAVAKAFTFGAFEVEGVEQVLGNKDDLVIDLKVLPDRACYALSHRGAAYELAAITGQKSTVDLNATEFSIGKIDIDEKTSIMVEDQKLCRAYLARRVNDVTVENSPVWLKERLGAVGQRSINNIVDATNFVMLDLGQPLHAFDADKIKGGIHVRLAKASETIELLPERNLAASGIISRNVSLQKTDLVVADDLGPIALAGVKGGLRAAVTDTTKNLIIESANFDPVSVRKTSTRLTLRNEASKRFENGLSVDLTSQAIEAVTILIKKLCPMALVGPVTKVVSKRLKPTSIVVSGGFISDKLGVVLKDEVIENIFTRLQITFKNKNKNQNSIYTLTIPPARLDLTGPEDIVEEIGRIYGYDKIAPSIPEKISELRAIDQFAYWTEKIKDRLFGLGFSEVQTYSLVDKSATSDPNPVEIQNPLASDKNFLRDSLCDGLIIALKQNVKNAAILGLDEIKIFEIGTVFHTGEEHLALGLGAQAVKKNKDEIYMTNLLDKVVGSISATVGKELNIDRGMFEPGAVVEIDLTKILPLLKKPVTWDIKHFSDNIKYKPFSVYPFMVRDVAVFVPRSVLEKEVLMIIDSVAGPLKVRSDLFDVFTKKFESGEEKTSYAFHIVFQSLERTLREEEVNEAMLKVSAELAARGWQVR